MLVGSYRTFWYFKFVAIYLAAAALLAVSAWPAVLRRMRRPAALPDLVLLSAAVYIPAVAFYEPISGTGTTRFLLAHIAPALFLIAMFFESEPFRNRRWSLAGID